MIEIGPGMTAHSRVVTLKTPQYIAMLMTYVCRRVLRQMFGLMNGPPNPLGQC